ncbi:hypothetical protein [Aureimonas sp. AU40]|uniref:hypothetical protein n=1 Tax=Aureimonas sp. AU40 TaxID=1637747 RepID=UPI0007817780|nr:hypothetical protein [Aureimonas sp. AU40]
MALHFLRFPVVAPIVAASLLGACTSMSGPQDLLGSVSPAPAQQQVTSGTLPPPPGLSAHPQSAPLTPGRIVSSAQPAPVVDLEERVPETPTMRVEALGDLPRRADGVMILPPAPRLDVIDIGAVRDGLAGTPPRSARSAPVTSPSAPPAAQGQGGLL